jgi:Uma2 family endonuclease
MLKDHAGRIGEEFWTGADLVMEVVIGGDEDRRRDLQIKRQEYAQAGISEYWIIDPQEERITVLRLVGKRYVVHGEFPKGTVASSYLLRGFTVDVSETFAQQLHQAAVAKRTQKPRR